MNSEDNPHIAVSFFSKDPSLKIPDDTFNIPISSDVEKLNLLIQAAVDDCDVNYDFIVGDVIITNTIDNYLTEAGKTIEGCLKLECIGKQNPPRPDKDIPHNDWVGAVKVTNNYILSGTFDGVLNIFDHGGQNLLKKELSSDPIKCMDINIDKNNNKVFCITGHQDQTLALNEITKDENQKVQLVTTAILRGHTRSVDCVTMKNGKIVSGSYDSTLKVWDTDLTKNIFVENNKEKKKKVTTVTKTPLVTLQSHKEGISGVSWNNENDKQVATVSWDHSIILWDLNTSTVASKIGSNKSFTSIAMHPSNSTCITGSVDPIARLWDLRCNSGSMVKSSFQSHKSWISAVEWCNTKDHLFVTASYDNSIKLWDVRVPKVNLYDLFGHEDRVLCVDWSDFGIIASGSVDATKMGKGFQNFMSKKDFHPSAIWNLKRKYEALEKQKMEEKRQAEMDELYKKEQEILEHKALLGDEKAKLGLSFMYDAPAGINKREEENKPEPKFEWQRKYNAPREAYARNNDQIVDQPFGIEVRHVRCVKCKKWGHLNTDSECPMFSKDDELISTNPSEIFKAGRSNTAVSSKQEPSVSKRQLVFEMKEEHGLQLKQKILSNIRTDECLNALGKSEAEKAKEEAFQKFYASFSDADKYKILQKILKKEAKKEKKKRRKEEKRKHKKEKRV
uniref:Ribosome biogenesis protein WDR12 (inferred by orthology to a human protein) n=2 Tax=Strongyloides TaxID=6247 RepID=A0A0K0FVP7_STRVS